MADGRWQFWIDRGGTFTDIVARRPDGSLAVDKLLSDDPEHYDDAAIEGINRFLGSKDGKSATEDFVDSVKLGTTVATNALLEHKGEPTLLAITRGFGDALRIGSQHRPNIFALNIILPEMLYSSVLEIEERHSATGEVICPLNEAAAHDGLTQFYRNGLRAIAIVLMHGYRYPAHERRLSELAAQVGFTQISVSHEVNPLMKLVDRGDTTVVDAYLSPVLGHYVRRTKTALPDTARFYLMQSNGGLTDAARIRGKDAVLSGPAGGIVGMARTAQQAGFDKVIGFDMGGTSTDVSHFAGQYERIGETVVAGARLKTPMMHIHTIAAGGGSICYFDGGRLRVGPHSAGAVPGPACYRRGGPLTVTDCNVMLGKLQPDYFPKVFGAAANEPIDTDIVRARFTELSRLIQAATGSPIAPSELAKGFIRIAVENMAAAIKKISVERGYDATQYSLACFGGAGGQHACLVADALQMPRVVIHPLAGVLSAYGMGLAELRSVRQASVEATLEASIMPQLIGQLEQLSSLASTDLVKQGSSPAAVVHRAFLKYVGTDSPLEVSFGSLEELFDRFATIHRARFGFTADRSLVVERLEVEAIGAAEALPQPCLRKTDSKEPKARQNIAMRAVGTQVATPLYLREELEPGHTVMGPALIAETTGTIVVEPDWRATVDPLRNVILERNAPAERRSVSSVSEPVMLEVFNNLFMAVAEQMGHALQNTAYSVNIKERLDFSCAVFDADGALIANAPHMPVHLGSMGESVKQVIARRGSAIKPGDAFMLNDPYRGGTHLPDITVIMPVFIDSDHPQFYVASRGHHADIGGITPGSMPPLSRTIAEEGVLIDDFLLVRGGKFCETEVRGLLNDGPYPARNPDQNVEDLKAQLAACVKGADELRTICGQYGLEVVSAYMGHVQDNAAEAVRRAIARLHGGKATCAMDDGSAIVVEISIDKENRSARVDFTGTSKQLPTNFNAPIAVCRAAVLYVFRTLIDEDIPLNDGCLRPIEIHIPEGCLLNPKPPAAIVAGNVETCQIITDALYAALGVLANSQGTMNNFTFGDGRYQYYETVCGGAGAGPDFDGADAVHTHMTNSRLTDPEVLEWRFPVLLERFSIRQGSGGDGGHRGGKGVIREIRFRKPMTAAILSGRRVRSPSGLAGGGEATTGRNSIRRRDGSVEHVSGTQVVEMSEGDSFIIETPGGGGFGPASGLPQE
jgi:5-oxoprolinase (ATP-hydrolysing)